LEKHLTLPESEAQALLVAGEVEEIETEDAQAEQDEPDEPDAPF
jgi:hypothetical protein